ncbi:P-loop containing nucleoside triphosphate hydrolase protein [Collybia nuda]|uniref:P-loop containing nucleoside triphosphate hydrolase protein n=1 Tax=Collybia nuda TaxID=64659 RepID=A0A9P5Y9N7_9AGAR|nr:P-loop containing nucleoside triphosphate hydrolase protein [Collybia nuda]
MIASLLRLFHMSPPLVELCNVSCVKDEQPLFRDVNLVVNEVILRGKSGSGKTTLLKCIAHLILYGGSILYRGSAPTIYGVPSYRIRVLYVPQRPSMLPGSPQDFLSAIIALDAHKALAKKSAQRTSPLQRAMDIASSWDISPQLWDREWSNLSGGEAQRIALAIALGLDSAELLLLDEPTSALDPASSLAVERYLINEVRSERASLKAIMWITHSDEQGGRVGNKFIQISGGKCREEQGSSV